MKIEEILLFYSLRAVILLALITAITCFASFAGWLIKLRAQWFPVHWSFLPIMGGGASSVFAFFLVIYLELSNSSQASLIFASRILFSFILFATLALAACALRFYIKGDVVQILTREEYEFLISEIENGHGQN